MGGLDNAREAFIDSARRDDLALLQYKKITNTVATSFSVAALESPTPAVEQRAPRNGT